MDALDRIDVLDDAGHQVAGGALVEVVDRQPLQPRIDITAHVIDHGLFQRVVDDNAQAVEDVAQQKGGDQGQDHGDEQVNAVLADDLVNHGADQPRIGQRKTQREQRTAHGAKRHEAVRLQKDRHPPHDLRGRTRLRRERRVRVRRRMGMMMIHSL
jgi:hypothetical protein